MVLDEPELGGVLDGDDPLVLGDEARHDVEERRLTGSGTTRDEDVEPRFDARSEELHHLVRRGPELHVVGDLDAVLRELSDRHHGAVQGEWRDDDVHARAVRKTRVLERLRFVDAPADRSDDPLDDPHHVLVGLERHIRKLELALPLDIDPERAVHHDLGHGVVVEERLDRPEAEDLVDDLLEHPLTLDARDDRAVLVDEPVEHVLDLGADSLHVREVEPRVEVVDDLGLERRAKVAVEVPGRCRRLGERAGGGSLGAERALLRTIRLSGRGRGLGGASGALAFDSPQ